VQTERLTLRQFTEADLENLVALDSDPEVMRYLNGGIPTPREVIARDILPRFIQSYAPGGFGFWAIVERASGAFLGRVGLLPDDERPGEATLGYRLLRAAWGHGYATEAARALLRATFREAGVQRVTATTYQDNRASRQVMDRLGMTLARTFRYTPQDLAAAYDSYVPSADLWDGDDVEYALTRADWERMEEAREQGGQVG
jgi:RimJ/RimL family protein N-acetyltransferase